MDAERGPGALTAAAGASAVKRRELVVSTGSPTVSPWTGALIHSDSVTITFDGANLCVGVSFLPAPAAASACTPPMRTGCHYQ